MPASTGTVYIGQKASIKTKKAKGGLLQKKELSKLEELEQRAELIIFEVVSRSPLFSFKKGDVVTICPNRVTVTKNAAFASEEYPMAIENITGASVYKHWGNASLSIETFGVPKPDPIKNLNANDARLARRYILALIECKKANIDLSGLELEDLQEKLKKIGMVRFSTDSDTYHRI